MNFGEGLGADPRRSVRKCIVEEGSESGGGRERVGILEENSKQQQPKKKKKNKKRTKPLKTQHKPNTHT